ncbi:hypothetical protein DBR12_00200 [Acidovorax sp. HMWF029]|nr:hypothetical protein DBR12_00200 [Acidovorax sp. HMWF029]
MRRPYYYSTDSLHLLQSTEQMLYLRLGNGRILGLLQSMKVTGEGYRKYFDDYPAVLCEPLELFYCCRRGMCSLNDELLQDLLFSFGWREANWGAWLSALAPRASYIPHLRSRAESLPHGKEVMSLALAACGEPLTEEIEVQHSLLQDIVTMLNKLPTVNFPMRRTPSLLEETAFNAEVESLRRCYRETGLSQAKEQLGKGLLYYYGMSHTAWLKVGAPEAFSHDRD